MSDQPKKQDRSSDEDQFQGFEAIDMATIGLNAIAYAKPDVSEDGQPIWSIHAANGASIGTASSWDLAAAAITQHDMTPLSVH